MGRRGAVQFLRSLAARGTQGWCLLSAPRNTSEAEREGGPAAGGWGGEPQPGKRRGQLGQLLAGRGAAGLPTEGRCAPRSPGQAQQRKGSAGRQSYCAHTRAHTPGQPARACTIAAESTAHTLVHTLPGSRLGLAQSFPWHLLLLSQQPRRAQRWAAWPPKARNQLSRAPHGQHVFGGLPRPGLLTLPLPGLGDSERPGERGAAREPAARPSLPAPGPPSGTFKAEALLLLLETPGPIMPDN